MSFDVGDSFNQLADAVCSAPVIGSVLSSPIWAALLLTALAAVIMLAVYHGSVARTLRGPDASRAVRAFIYVFGAIAIVTALHYHATVASVGTTATRVGFRDVVGAAEAARAAGSEYPVNAVHHHAGHAVHAVHAAGGAASWPANEPVPNLTREYVGGLAGAMHAPAASPIAVPTPSLIAVPGAVPVGVPVAVPVAVPGTVPVAVPVGVPVGVPGAVPVAVQDAGPGIPSVSFALPRLVVPTV